MDLFNVLVELFCKCCFHPLGYRIFFGSFFLLRVGELDGLGLLFPGSEAVEGVEDGVGDPDDQVDEAGEDDDIDHLDTLH